jgi:rSAM/selenodomain-associated transferase 1
MSRLYFAAKAPVAGQVKTRLGATIGMDASANLYAAFLRDLVTRFAEAPFEIAWYITPGSWTHLEPLVGRAVAVRIQRGTDWAARQANLFRECHATGEGMVVLAATDSPQLDRSRVEEAFSALETRDVVLGPTPDGGYYLVGMRRFNDIFADAFMSTNSALESVLQRAREKCLSVALLEPEFDVDTEQDLSLVEREVNRRQDLGHTAAALALIRDSGVMVA